MIGVVTEGLSIATKSILVLCCDRRRSRDKMWSGREALCRDTKIVYGQGSDASAHQHVRQVRSVRTTSACARTIEELCRDREFSVATDFQ